MNQGSSSSVPFAAKAKVKGIPCACWCGAPIVPMNSRSERNPCRRFYRCSFAVSEQLRNDKHVFKWIDDALVDEVEILHNSVDRVENMVMEKLEDTLMDLAENFIMNKVEYLLMQKAEQIVKEKVELVVKEQLEHVVKVKVEELVEQVVKEKLENLVLEKVQEELLCMNLK